MIWIVQPRSPFNGATRWNLFDFNERIGIMAYHYPPPAEWQTFQSLVAGFAASQYEQHSVHEYGRSGQRQNGVDIFARDHFGKNVGIQCKWTSGDLAESALADECNKAVSFTPELNVFILWTTSRRDVRLQDAAHRLEQSGDYKFQVVVRFWDDAIEHLNRAFSVAQTYYDDWLEHNHVTADRDHRSKLRIAVDRPAFNDPIFLERSFADLWRAIKDTAIFLKTGLLYDRYDRTLIVQALPFSMMSDSDYVEELTGILELLTRLDELLGRAASRFHSPVLTDAEDVEECDRIRREIVQIAHRLRD